MDSRDINGGVQTRSKFFYFTIELSQKKRIISLLSKKINIRSNFNLKTYFTMLRFN